MDDPRRPPAGPVAADPPHPPPWVWHGLPAGERLERWRQLVDWVDWLEEAYAPWVVLPPCWPAHEGLRAELTQFHSWHDWLVTRVTDPEDGIRWHAELRRAAGAWRAVAHCDHREPGPEHDQVRAARRAARDRCLAEVVEAADPAGGADG